MEISALLTNAPSEAPRRSSSNAHSITTQSPVATSAKLPTPPVKTPTPLRRKRERHDIKPIWAVLEHEIIPEGTYEQPKPRQLPVQPPHAAHTAPLAHPPPQQRSNGPPGPPPQMPNEMGFLPTQIGQLIGFERPITNNGKVYDEISRKVCDFIWKEVIENVDVRNAVAESPRTEVEIEARWGQILDHNTNMRLTGMHETECVVRRNVAASTKFESTMSLEQHKRMNEFLNQQVSLSMVPNQSAPRERVNYKHTKEVDTLYELDQQGFNLLAPATKKIFAESRQRFKIRVSRDMKDGKVVKQIIKHRLGNLEISSPLTEWDYRIGINLEVEFPGSVEHLVPVVENGRPAASMQRMKDRVSYSWLNAYQIDLTQVRQGQSKNHELELELNGDLVLAEADKCNQEGQLSAFEALVAGMMNNLRVLSREMTP